MKIKQQNIVSVKVQHKLKSSYLCIVLFLIPVTFCFVMWLANTYSYKMTLLSLARSYLKLSKPCFVSSTMLHAKLYSFYESTFIEIKVVSIKLAKQLLLLSMLVFTARKHRVDIFWPHFSKAWEIEIRSHQFPLRISQFFPHLTLVRVHISYQLYLTTFFL